MLTCCVFSAFGNALTRTASDLDECCAGRRMYVREQAHLGGNSECSCRCVREERSNRKKCA